MVKMPKTYEDNRSQQFGVCFSYCIVCNKLEQEAIFSRIRFVCFFQLTVVVLKSYLKNTMSEYTGWHDKTFHMRLRPKIRNNKENKFSTITIWPSNIVLTHILGTVIILCYKNYLKTSNAYSTRKKGATIHVRLKVACTFILECMRHIILLNHRR